MTVSIIVTSFLEQSKPYLDLCIRSIRNLDYPMEETEIIIVSPNGYEPEYEGCKTVHPQRAKYFNSHAMNYGAEAASPESKYLLILNDDVILSRGCLTNLLGASRWVGETGLLMPVGNDWQGKYILRPPYLTYGPYRFDGKYISQSHEPSIKIQPEALMDAANPYQTGGVFLYETLCLYAYLIPKKVFKKVGGMNDSIQSGDDVDFTRRMRKAGFLNAIVPSALCFHAMGITADQTLGAMDSEERKNGLDSFRKEWGDEPEWSNA